MKNLENVLKSVIALFEIGEDDTKNYSRAVDLLKSVKKKKKYLNDPYNYLIDFRLGQASLMKEIMHGNKFTPERIDEIIGLFQNSLSLNPDFIDCHYYLGTTHRIKFKITGCKEYGEKAIEYLESASKSRRFKLKSEGLIAEIRDKMKTY